MKPLKENFVQNADKSGDNRFIQVRKEKDAAVYRRELMDGKLVGFEVFRFKTIKAGSPLPGGGTVDEDYESYPGGKAFGRSAWFIGGVNVLNRAVQRFNELLTGKVVAVVETETETDETETVSVVNVSSRPVKDGFQWPSGRFTQKELAAFNKIENYKQVYSDLQKGLASGILRIAGQRDNPSGKRSAKEFEVVAG